MHSMPIVLQGNIIYSEDEDNVMGFDQSSDKTNLKGQLGT